MGSTTAANTIDRRSQRHKRREIVKSASFPYSQSVTGRERDRWRCSRWGWPRAHSLIGSDNNLITWCRAQKIRLSRGLTRTRLKGHFEMRPVDYVPRQNATALSLSPNEPSVRPIRPTFAFVPSAPSSPAPHCEKESPAFHRRYLIHSHLITHTHTHLESPLSSRSN